MPPRKQYVIERRELMSALLSPVSKESALAKRFLSGTKTSLRMMSPLNYLIKQIRSLLSHHASGNFIWNSSCLVTFHALLNNKTLNLVPIRDILGPHNSQVGDGSISRPPLSSIKDVTTFNLLRGGLHVGCIGAVLWFGKSKASNLVQLD